MAPQRKRCQLIVFFDMSTDVSQTPPSTEPVEFLCQSVADAFSCAVEFPFPHPMNEFVSGSYVLRL